MDLHSIQTIYSVLFPAQKNLAVWVQLSFFAGKSCCKGKEDGGPASPSLGAALKDLLLAAESALPLKPSSSDLDCATLVWLDFLAWPQPWFIMTDLLADQWPEADPDHCLQTCSWSGLTNTTSWHLWVRQYSCLCCNPQLQWSVPSLVEQPDCTAPSIVPVTLQSSAFQMQNLLGFVKCISMSVKPGQEREVLYWRYFQNSRTLYPAIDVRIFWIVILVKNLKQATVQNLQHFWETMAHVFLPSVELD